MASYTASMPARRNIPGQIIAALLGGLLLTVLVISALTGVYRLAYNGRILPGVSVAGIDVSGLPPQEAIILLNGRLTYPVTGHIAFRDGDQVWIATPVELGMVFDIGASVQNAYNTGRKQGLIGNLAGQMRTLRYGVDIAPVAIMDQRVASTYLLNIAAQVDRPVVETDLRLSNGVVIYTPGTPGRVLDPDATLASLRTLLQTYQDGEVALVIREQAPLVTGADAQADVLRAMLSAPLLLTLPDPQPGDPGPWSVEPSILGGMVAITPPAETGGQFQVAFITQALQPLLLDIASRVDRKPANARFIFNDSTRQLDLMTNAIIGRSVDVTASVGAIQSALAAGQHSVPLTIVTQQPSVGDGATADSLGISGLVSSQVTYFRGSSTARMQNIEIAGARFHGLLIAPGETFSMGDILGDVSLENGYAEAMIIYNGKTIKGVGGGVCQVSTTLFRTAFFGGYPVVERTPHAYRVYYYEQSAASYDSNLAGLDATVYFPLVDFKFTNDRGAWLLMEVYVNKSAQKITWKFYSADDGRSVDWTTSGPQNIVPPPDPVFEMVGDLGANEMRQTDWAAEGAEVTVIRSVLRSGLVLFSDTFRTRYQPWQAICEYGPGTDDWVGLAKDLGLCQAP